MMPEMCPGGLEPEKVYDAKLYNEDGEILEMRFDGWRIPTIEPSPDWQPDEQTQKQNDALANPPTISVDIKLKSPAEIMHVKTRKRFIKMLLSCGVSRNDAAFAAQVPMMDQRLGQQTSYAQWFNTLIYYSGIRLPKSAWRL